METRGEKVTFISAGERKTAGHPYGPLDEASAAELQGGVNDYYDKFVRAVARGRNVSLTTVRSGFGKGGIRYREFPTYPLALEYALEWANRHAKP
jgi:ClpP class serine protease